MAAYNIRSVNHNLSGSTISALRALPFAPAAARSSAVVSSIYFVVATDIVQDNSIPFDAHNQAVLIGDRDREKAFHFSSEPMQLQGWCKGVESECVKLLLHELAQLWMFSQEYAQAATKTRCDKKLVQSTRLTRSDVPQ